MKIVPDGMIDSHPKTRRPRVLLGADHITYYLLRILLPILLLRHLLLDVIFIEVFPLHNTLGQHFLEVVRQAEELLLI